VHHQCLLRKKLLRTRSFLRCMPSHLLICLPAVRHIAAGRQHKRCQTHAIAVSSQQVAHCCGAAGAAEDPHADSGQPEGTYRMILCA